MIEKLRIYADKKESIRNTAEEIQRLESEITSIRSATKDGTPVSGGTNHREDRLVNNIVARQEIASTRRQTIAWVQGMDAALSKLDQEDYHIIDVLYIHPVRGGIDQLCEEFCVAEPTTIYRRKNKIIRRLTFLLYGIPES